MSRIDELDAMIADLAREKEVLLRAEKEAATREARNRNGVKVVCPSCHGEGSDPPWDETCYDCSGDGFQWAVKWPGERGDYESLLEEIAG